MEESKPTDLRQAQRQLAQARETLDSILKANRRDGVWNEHVFRSESAARELVAHYATEVARLTRRPERDDMVAQNSDMDAKKILLSAASSGDQAKQQ